ncbi:MAG: hypothetical protein ACXVZM_11590 [Terriglobales bacterium]
MKAAVAFLLLAGLLSLAPVQTAEAADRTASPIFPMDKGATWTYRAHVKWEKGEQDIHWTMTVTDSFESPQLSAALLRGGPWVLAFYQPHVRAAQYLVVRLATTYYLVKDGAADTFSEIIAGSARDMQNRLSDDLWFRLPLHENDTFCSPDTEPGSSMNCWATESVATNQTLKIGKVTVQGVDSYQLLFRSNPDHEMVTLVPGIGITAWEYMHHGTTSQANVRLIEFRSGK